MPPFRLNFTAWPQLILLGGAGLVTCVSFVWLSAPDLALTQIVVETVTTVLLLLGLRWLPKRVPRISPSSAIGTIRWHRVRDFAIALLAGVGLAALALASMQRPAPDSISRYFVENAYTKGGGTNVVNVILVDFRGLRYVRGDHCARGRCTDRLMRCCAASVRRPKAFPFPNSSMRRTPMTTRIPIARRATPKGYAGYCSADNGVAVSGDRRNGHLPALAGARPSGRRLRRWHRHGSRIHPAVHGSRHGLGGGASARMPVRWMGLASCWGIWSCRLGFRTPVPDLILCYTELPLIGRVPTASALLFDIGVFSLVVGATVLMLIAIAHQSLRRYGVPLPGDNARSGDRPKEEME